MAGLGAAAALPGVAAHALQFKWANCSSGTRTSPFATASKTARIATFADWRIGDCELQSASLTINASGAGSFSAQVCTHFTHSKDIWHFGVALLGAANDQNFYTLFSWDSPPLSEQDRPLFHSWSESFHVDPQLFHKANFARATSCC